MNATLLLVGIGAGIAHSLYSLVSKFLLKKRISAPLVFLLYISLSQAMLTPVLWFFVPPALPSPGGWPFLLAASGTCAIAYVFLYASLSCGDVSSVMPMMGSKVIFSGIFAHFLLGETHGPSMYFAVLLVAVAVAALSYSPSHAHGPNRAGTAALLMLVCCLIFGLTDILIKRSLEHLDTYNFLVYYNLLVAVAVLPVIPWLRRKRQPLGIGRSDLLYVLLATLFVIAATLLFVQSFNLADGVILPNILFATRGVFIVVFAAMVGTRKSMALDVQSKWVFALRLAASALLIFSVWLALHKPRAEPPDSHNTRAVQRHQTESTRNPS